MQSFQVYSLVQREKLKILVLQFRKIEINKIISIKAVVKFVDGLHFWVPLIRNKICYKDKKFYEEKYLNIDF